MTISSAPGSGSIPAHLTVGVGSVDIAGAPTDVAVLDALGCGVLIHDAAGAIVHANPVAERLIGAPAEELRGRVPLGALWTAADEDDRPLGEADAPPMVALRTGRPVRGRVVSFGRPGAPRRWAQLDAVPLLNGDGRVEQVVTTLTDLSRRKEIEQQVAKLAALEPRRQLGEMVLGIAHDVNHYLALAIGHAEIARRLLASVPEAAAEIEPSLASIDAAAAGGAALVRRLLTYGRPHEGGRPERLRVYDVLQEVRAFTRPQWHRRARDGGRPILVKVEGDSQAVIAGVEADLREAVTNMIFNAIDAMPTGGTISLSVRRQGARVLIDVTDSGVGISPEVQKHMFEPYFTTKGQAGTGLGLATVHGIIHGLGGEIDVRSSPGTATTFTISLPALDPDPSEPEPVRPDQAPRPSDAGPPLRVLVVEDEPGLASMLGDLLRVHRHLPAVVPSAEAALGRFDAERFDVVLTDVCLGRGMNGWDLIEALRARRPDVPIVLVTGGDPEADPKPARPAAPDDVLTKPFRRDRLLAAIRRAFEAHRPVGSAPTAGG